MAVSPFLLQHGPGAQAERAYRMTAAFLVHVHSGWPLGVLNVHSSVPAHFPAPSRTLQSAAPRQPQIVEVAGQL